MKEQIRPTLVLLAAFTLLTGLAYPLVVTAVAQVAFPQQANGSLVMRDGRPVGSNLIGQEFTDPRYFWGRPSATSPTPYNAEAGAGSNYGPLNPKLKEAVAQRLAALRKSDPKNAQPVPVDLVTASGSGLDPHISPAAAEYQVGRVARLRRVPEETLRRAIAECTESRQLGFLGEPRVNVLKLNLALDAMTATHTEANHHDQHHLANRLDRSRDPVGQRRMGEAAGAQAAVGAGLCRSQGMASARKGPRA
jgi:potassium-transporting ATPase KdpC subunit